MVKKTPPILPKKTLTLLQTLQKAMDARRIESYTKESYKWLMNQAKKLSSPTLASKLIKEERKRALRKDVSKINIGSLVMYFYEAKGKDELEYWDSFPVGFVIGAEHDRFQILNLHYISPRIRSIILDKLLAIANNASADQTTKLRLSYAVIKNASRFKVLKPCYHEYLFTHVRSKVIKIHPSDWEKCIFLPLAKFNKASNSRVWSDSAIKSNTPPKP